MRLLMDDRTVKRPIGILHDVLVKVESFIFLADFVILDCEVDFEVPIILGRQFLATGSAYVDMEKGHMKFQFNNEEATFNICRSMRQSGELQSVSSISHKVSESFERQIQGGITIMYAIVHPVALFNLFSTFTKLSTCCSFRSDTMITGKVSPFPNNSYLR